MRKQILYAHSINYIVFNSLFFLFKKSHRGETEPACSIGHINPIRAHASTLDVVLKATIKSQLRASVH